MKTSIVIDISPPITYLAKFCFSSYGRKCCWPIELQDSLKCNISRKKWMMLFLACRENSKFSKNWYYHFGCAYLDMPKVPKIRSLHIYAISSEKHGVEVVLLPADKFESFLQSDSILDVCKQACPKYLK